MAWRLLTSTYPTVEKLPTIDVLQIQFKNEKLSVRNNIGT